MFGTVKLRILGMNFNKAFFYILFLAVMGLTANTVTAAQIYKWVDEDGQVHYGRKPKDKNAKEMTITNRYIDSGSVPPPLSAQERVDKQKKFIDALDAENKSLSDEKRKKREQ